VTVPEFKVVRLRECAVEKFSMCTPEEAAEFWRRAVVASDWYSPEREQFVVMFLNTRKKLVGFAMVSVGILDSCCFHPREVFRAAIIANAAAIIIGHNHPSGDATPSEADVKATRELIQAGRIMKIEVVDHVIIGDQSTEQPRGFVSLRELGYFYS